LVTLPPAITVPICSFWEAWFALNSINFASFYRKLVNTYKCIDFILNKFQKSSIVTARFVHINSTLSDTQKFFEAAICRCTNESKLDLISLQSNQEVIEQFLQVIISASCKLSLSISTSVISANSIQSLSISTSIEEQTESFNLNIYQ